MTIIQEAANTESLDIKICLVPCNILYGHSNHKTMTTVAAKKSAPNQLCNKYQHDVCTSE